MLWEKEGGYNALWVGRIGNQINMAVGYAAYILPLLLLGCWAEAYLDLCYCPGVDQELVELDKPESKILRDRLHELRREYTASSRRA